MADGSFVREDPWRVFRIMAEFVEGFEVMSQVGPAVSVFGCDPLSRKLGNVTPPSSGGATKLALAIWNSGGRASYAKMPMFETCSSQLIDRAVADRRSLADEFEVPQRRRVLQVHQSFVGDLRRRLIVRDDVVGHHRMRQIRQRHRPGGASEAVW